jgi:hypothetical protein
LEIANTGDSHPQAGISDYSAILCVFLGREAFTQADADKNSGARCLFYQQYGRANCFAKISAA